MANAAAHAHDEHAHDHPTGWRRWLMSTNHKDIGILYLIFAIVAGIVGGGLSGFMREELMQPGMQVLTGLTDGDIDRAYHMWNMMISAHGVIMVFFMVMPGLIGGFGN